MPESKPEMCAGARDKWDKNKPSFVELPILTPCTECGVRASYSPHLCIECFANALDEHPGNHCPQKGCRDALADIAHIKHRTGKSQNNPGSSVEDVPNDSGNAASSSSRNEDFDLVCSALQTIKMAQVEVLEDIVFQLTLQAEQMQEQLSYMRDHVWWLDKWAWEAWQQSPRDHSWRGPSCG